MPVSRLRRPPCTLRAAVLTATVALLCILTPTAVSASAATTGTSAARHGGANAEQVPGMDVSRHQGTVDWQGAWDNGARWAYVKATEGTDFQSPTFPEQFQGAYDVGMIRGAYHFARPDTSGAAVQAHNFVDHGGMWTDDGRTLPPALDIEYNPTGGDVCYGRSQSDMVAWIREFSDTVHELTGRHPAIYTTTDWWTQCTGNDASFGSNPLWIARYAASPGTLPAGWSDYTFWQYSDSGTFPGDQNWFNGTQEELEALAKG
ncbi:lysozyme [Streptomyces sp. NPDC051776]|uniref:lysozyme n=1 Tax=Streptomyces sp. NPDC051776 TaxID=3155414 RepID=UPI003434051A